MDYWCDAVTIDTFLDYVGADLYQDPNATAANESNLYPVQTSKGNNYTLMACTAIGGGTCNVGLVGGVQFGPATSFSFPSGFQFGVNEFSGFRWPFGGSGDSGECGTAIGQGWQTWSDNGSAAGRFGAIPHGWAPSVGASYFVMYSSPPLVYMSNDPNNTHAINNCSGFAADNYMTTMMANIGVSGAGASWAAMNPTPGPVFTTQFVGPVTGTGVAMK
jgi:hypothetical protein